jgi:3-phosphoshikimate 1-carboxyvinyltransferase
MEQELAKLGAKVTTAKDSMTVHGGAPLTGALVDCRDDHRIAMALCIAGLCAEGAVTVKDAECAAVSFPGFFALMAGVGADVEVRD